MELVNHRLLKWLAVGILAVFMLYLFLLPTPVPVDLATVQKGGLEVTIDEEGVTQVREIYTISAPIMGLVSRAPLQIGDPVEKDRTVVASIHPTDPSFLDERSTRIATARMQAAEAALQFSNASVTRAEAELRFARSELKRAEKLLENKTVSERTYEAAKLSLATATAAVETAKADVEVKKQELDSARAQLIGPLGGDRVHSAKCCMKIKAPENGRVLRIYVESETVVSSGAPLMEIGDPNDLEIVLDLLSKDAVRISEGAEAYIEDWGGSEVLRARVRRIESSAFRKVSALGIEEQRVKVRLDPISPPATFSRVGHDYRVYARIVLSSKSGVLTVPLSALFRDGTQWAVYKRVAGKAQLQVVGLGARNKHAAEVLSGLKAGDNVILHPGDRIENGSRVTERKTTLRGN
ncbi:MAG: hypothetical protein RLZ98_2596 [Pseudomonadota bacterium]|jgi:HlyD family secretion protein